MQYKWLLSALCACMVLVVGIGFEQKSVARMLCLGTGLLLLSGMGISSAEAGESQEIHLPFWHKDAWLLEGSGAHEGWADRRNLFVLYHPWEESQPDQSGSVVQDVVIPEDWNAPVTLHFYMTDDYQGEGPRLEEGNWLGQMALLGHRFKQVLVDGEVIWEADVADPEGVSEPSQFSIPLPSHVKAGERIRLEFRLIDKIGSTTRSGDDFRHIGTTDGIEASEPWRFMTHLYIGDVRLTPEAPEAADTPQSPSAKQARELHQKRWPLPPYGEDLGFPVPLQWEGWNPKSGFPTSIRCGIPLPAGRIQNAAQIALRTQAGESLPLQAHAMNFWQDGSLRWVEIDSIVTSEDAMPDGQLWLDIRQDGESTPEPDHPVSVVEVESEGLQLHAGNMSILVGRGRDILISRIQYGATAFTNLRGRIEIDGKAYSAQVESTRVLASGRVRGEIELSGTVRSEQNEMGQFVFRIAAMADQPYFRMTWRVFNGQPNTLAISRFELVGECATTEDTITYWGNASKSGNAQVLMRQLEEDRFEVLSTGSTGLDSGEASPGWLALVNDDQSLLVSVRHFRQQFPKALEVNDSKLRIALFEASATEPHYVPSEGEAKRHEIWLGLWDRRITTEEMTEVARMFSRPARLFSAEYFCASGGFGYATPHSDQQFADIDAHMKATYGDIGEHRFYVRGIRNWGDYPYQKDNNAWCNGYYDRPQGFASEYLMTGDPRWFDRLEATVRHMMDVDVCHASEEHPEQVGAIYSCYSPNHNQGGIWVMMQRTKGLLAYWRLTGDLDARAAGLGSADFVIRSNQGLGRGSVRDHGGALYCLMAAYDETLDSKYLDAARMVAHDAMGRIDSRRGCYSEVHGNMSYRGNVPWMVAQLAQPMYEYYRASGDVDAAAAVVGMAESILTENATRGALGDVYGYSHNPHFKKTSGYHVLIAPAILYAYELTGDDFFLEHGRAMFEQTIQEKSVNAINNCYWNVPTLLYYLKLFRQDGARFLLTR